MSWLKAVMRRLGLRREHPEAEPSAELREARRNLERTEDRLRTVKGETSEILLVANNLKRLGAQNDFAARIKDALGGPSG